MRLFLLSFAATLCAGFVALAAVPPFDGAQGWQPRSVPFDRDQGQDVAPPFTPQPLPGSQVTGKRVTSDDPGGHNAPLVVLPPDEPPPINGEGLNGPPPLPGEGEGVVVDQARPPVQPIKPEPPGIVAPLEPQSDVEFPGATGKVWIVGPQLNACRGGRPSWGLCEIATTEQEMQAACKRCAEIYPSAQCYVAEITLNQFQGTGRIPASYPYRGK